MYIYIFFLINVYIYVCCLTYRAAASRNVPLPLSTGGTAFATLQMKAGNTGCAVDTGHAALTGV